jgi:hypothetical protein
MNDAFRSWLDQAIAEAARTPGGIPLLGDAANALPANPDALIALLGALAIPRRGASPFWNAPAPTSRQQSHNRTFQVSALNCAH